MKCQRSIHLYMGLLIDCFEVDFLTCYNVVCRVVEEKLPSLFFDVLRRQSRCCIDMFISCNKVTDIISFQEKQKVIFSVFACLATICRFLYLSAAFEFLYVFL